MAKKGKKYHLGNDISVELSKVFADDSAPLPQFCLIQVGLAEAGGEEMALAQTAGELLTAAEMSTFLGFRFPHRRREWLAGRVAVKEAVRTLLAEPARALRDVEIGVDGKGKPFLATASGNAKAVHIAISHSGGSALGLASPALCSLDFQEIRSALARVESRFVRADEKALVKLCHPDELRALGLLWAGKEALRKYVRLWPLLGFLEARLHGVTDRGGGLYFSFQARPEKRELPTSLPGVLATMYGDNALALLFAGSEDSGR